MNIWIVYTYEPIPEIDGGHDRYRFGELCRALERAGHTVHWWQSTFNHITKKHRTSESKSVEVSQRLTIHLAHGPGYGSNVSLARVRHNRIVAHKLASMMRRQARPDVVLAGLPSLEAAEVCSLFCLERGIPFVLDAHDLWPDIYLNAAPTFLRPFLRALLCIEFTRARRTFARATALTAVSESYLMWALAYAARARSDLDNVYMLGYGARSPSSFEEEESQWCSLVSRYRIPQGRFIAVFAGTFGKTYDIESIVGAAELADREGDDTLHFILAGSGDKFDRTALRTGALQNVSLTGRITQVELAVILRRSNLGLSAYSSSATQSLPYKPFEYMAAGLPQLCSLKGEAIKMLVQRRTGAWYEPGNPIHLLAQIRKFQRKPKLVSYMAARALLAFKREFSMDSIYPLMAKNLERVAAHAAVKN